MKSTYVIGGIVIGGNTIRMNGLGMQVDGDAPFTTLPGATVREANQKGDLPPMTAAAPTAAGAAIAGNQGGYVSEIEQMLKLHPKTDAQGRLVDGVTGKVITEPENTDPLPERFNHENDAGVQAIIQWQSEHPYYRFGIQVDGGWVGTNRGVEPAARFSSNQEKGWLVRETNTTAPPAIPVTVVPVASSTADQDVVIRIGTERQRLTRSKGLGTGVFRVHLVAPNIPLPKEHGFVRMADAQGSDQHIGELKLIAADGSLISIAVGISPSISWSTAPMPNVDAVIPPGAAFTSEYRHTEALSTTAPNDVLEDVRNPA